MSVAFEGGAAVANGEEHEGEELDDVDVILRGLDGANQLRKPFSSQVGLSNNWPSELVEAESTEGQTSMTKAGPIEPAPGFLHAFQSYCTRAYRSEMVQVQTADNGDFQAWSRLSDDPHSGRRPTGAARRRRVSWGWMYRTWIE
jgi:hypothetical protein